VLHRVGHHWHRKHRRNGSCARCGYCCSAASLLSRTQLHSGGCVGCWRQHPSTTYPTPIQICQDRSLKTQEKQKHSESANFAKAKIRSWLQIRMSTALLPKCIGFILSSASVISPSQKMAGDCVRNANKSP